MFDAVFIKNRKPNCSGFLFLQAEDEARTRYLHLGKVALYQMSYSRRTKAIISAEVETVK